LVGQKVTVRWTPKGKTKMRKNFRVIDANTKQAAKDVAERVHGMAVSEAPKDTTNLRKHIHIKTVTKGHKGVDYTVYTTNPTEGGRNRVSPATSPGFNLATWMAETGGVLQSDNNYLLAITQGRLGHAGQQIIHSGNPRFMAAAKDFGRRLMNDYTDGKKIKRGLTK